MRTLIMKKLKPNMLGRLLVVMSIIFLPYLAGTLLVYLDPAFVITDEPVILIWAVGLLSIVAPIGVIMLLTVSIKWILTGNVQ